MRLGSISKHINPPSGIWSWNHWTGVTFHTKTEFCMKSGEAVICRNQSLLTPLGLRELRGSICLLWAWLMQSFCVPTWLPQTNKQAHKCGPHTHTHTPALCTDSNLQSNNLHLIIQHRAPRHASGQNRPPLLRPITWDTRAQGLVSPLPEESATTHPAYTAGELHLHVGNWAMELHWVWDPQCQSSEIS